MLKYSLWNGCILKFKTTERNFTTYLHFIDLVSPSSLLLYITLCLCCCCFCWWAFNFACSQRWQMFSYTYYVLKIIPRSNEWTLKDRTTLIKSNFTHPSINSSFCVKCIYFCHSQHSKNRQEKFQAIQRKICYKNEYKKQNISAKISQFYLDFFENQ